MNRNLVIPAAAATTLLLLGACASNPGQATAQTARGPEKAQPYLDHAGEPVPSFRLFGHVNSWNPLSDHQLVIRTGAQDAYLLSVDPTCMHLSFAHSIGLVTRTGNLVHSGFDYVRFDDGFQGQRCRITEIRPVDTAAMREAQRADG